MPDLKQVTYCGLYCGLCASDSRIPKQARDLGDSLRKEGFEVSLPTLFGRHLLT